MGKLISVFLFCILLNACSGRKNPEYNKLQLETYQGNSTQSSAVVFGDSSYTMTVRIFDTTNDHETSKHNALVILSRRYQNQNSVLMTDSIYSMIPEIGFEDFNNDRIPDITVFFHTGGRSNPTYHLYLTDPTNHQLIRINGFENLPNPTLDTTHNIIESLALSGTNHYSFYQIDKTNSLINLGQSFFENPKDSTQYKKAILKILGNR